MPLPVGVITGIIELGKLGLQAWFGAMRMTGKSDDEISAMYMAEKTEFYKNAPETLPNVPADTTETPNFVDPE